MAALLLEMQRLAGNRAVAGAVATGRGLPVQRYVLNPVAYNDDAQQRRAGSLRSEANIAVAYPVGPAGAALPPVVKWSERREPLGTGHAERLAIEATGFRKTGRPVQQRTAGWVPRVYTELEPCGSCKDRLKQLLEEDAVVEFTSWYQDTTSHGQFHLKNRAMHIAEIQFLLAHTGDPAGSRLPRADLALIEYALTHIHDLNKQGSKYDRTWYTDQRSNFAEPAKQLYRALLLRELGPTAPASSGTDPAADIRRRISYVTHHDGYLSMLSNVREFKHRVLIQAPVPTVTGPAPTTIGIPTMPTVPSFPTPAPRPSPPGPIPAGSPTSTLTSLRPPPPKRVLPPASSQGPAKKPRMEDMISGPQLGFLRDLVGKVSTTQAIDCLAKAIEGTSIPPRAADEQPLNVLRRLTRSAASTLIDLLKKELGTT